MKLNILPGSLARRAAGKYIRKKSYAGSRNRKITNWAEVKSIAFLVDGHDPAALRMLLNQLHAYAQKGKKVHIFGYVKKLPPFEEDGIYWFTNKDLNWAGLPKPSVLKALNIQTYDLLINTAEIKVSTLHYLSALSHATLRIGPYAEEWAECYDFMIIQDPGETVPELLKKAEYYLSTFNKQYAQVHGTTD